MLTRGLPPEVAPYFGPLAPAVGVVWDVVGLPVCEFCLFCWLAFEASLSLGEGLRGLAALIAVAVLMCLVVVVCVSGAVGLSVVAVVVAACWRTNR